MSEEALIPEGVALIEEIKKTANLVHNTYSQTTFDPDVLKDNLRHAIMELYGSLLEKLVEPHPKYLTAHLLLRSLLEYYLWLKYIIMHPETRTLFNKKSKKEIIKWLDDESQRTYSSYPEKIKKRIEEIGISSEKVPAIKQIAKNLHEEQCYDTYRMCSQYTHPTINCCIKWPQEASAGPAEHLIFWASYCVFHIINYSGKTTNIEMLKELLVRLRERTLHNSFAGDFLGAEQWTHNKPWTNTPKICTFYNRLHLAMDLHQRLLHKF